MNPSGSIGLVGASDSYVTGTGQGSAYVFRNLDTATGSITQNVTLVSSDGAADDNFGTSVGLSGSIGLVGASTVDIGGILNQGAAYVFRNLDTATGTITQNVKLIASDGATNDGLGNAVGLSGSIGLVGARADAIFGITQGSAYVFRNLDTATGIITENAKLIASDGVANDLFGVGISLSGNRGLIGASLDDFGSSTNQGSAYVFRNLDTATGTINQDVKLTASDGAASDGFGNTSSQSGSIGLVGARYDDDTFVDQGSAYVFRNLDTATGTITQNVKLIASDGGAYENFGNNTGLSGSIGLVAANLDEIGPNDNQGSVYLFLGLDTATGTITQNVKLIASDGAAQDLFGTGARLSGDQFLIGASGWNNGTGKAYSGSVSSVTTLNTGSTSRTIDGISFTTVDDWTIGLTTDANQVTLTAGDKGSVTALGKGVYIGKNAGSDNNSLLLSGSLTANAVYIGAVGNAGNTLEIGTTAAFAAGSFYLAPENFLTIVGGDYTNSASLLTYLGSTALQVWSGSAWDTVTSSNYSDLIHSNYSSGETTIHAVPEPSTLVLTVLGVGGLLLRRRRR